ncbi:MAG: hypothetical protein ACO1RA_12475 [Planctomycetaceae bacterium]
MTATNQSTSRATAIEEGHAARRQVASRAATSPRVAASEFPILFRIPDANGIMSKLTAEEKPSVPATTTVASETLEAKSAPALPPVAETKAAVETKPVSAAAAEAPAARLPAEKSEKAAAPSASESLAMAADPFASRRRFGNAAPAPAEPETSKLAAANTEQIKDTTPPAAATAPSPLERARLRERRQQEEATAPATEPNWFSSHGKYIAICFVVALIGTVCLARYKRERAQKAPQMAREEAVAPEATAEKSAAISKPVDANIGAVKPTSGISPAESTAPSLIPEVSPAGAETGPDFTNSPATTEVPASDSKSLFPWKGTNSSDRTATKPEAPANNSIYGQEPAAEAPAGTAYPETDPSNHRTVDPANPNQLRQGTKPRSEPLRSDSGTSQPNPSTISGIVYER